jgi:hypothetical protein
VPNSEAKQISFPLIKLAKKLKVDGKGKNAWEHLTFVTLKSGFYVKLF